MDFPRNPRRSSRTDTGGGAFEEGVQKIMVTISRWRNLGFPRRNASRLCRIRSAGSVTNHQNFKRIFFYFLAIILKKTSPGIVVGNFKWSTPLGHQPPVRGPMQVSCLRTELPEALNAPEGIIVGSLRFFLRARRQLAPVTQREARLPAKKY